MRLGLLCVGRLKAGPERELYARYADRVGSMRNLGFSGLDLKEIDESRARSPQERVAQEGEAILGTLEPAARLAVFDERGKASTSADFAQFLARERDSGSRSLWFAIGGSEGLHASVRERAVVVLSFGALTLPHQLVRILATEQIYRALTIISGHPYHRGQR